jgi:hypothetical protein
MKWYKEVQTKNHTVNQLKIPSERQVWMQNNPLSPKLKSVLFKYYHDGNGFKSIAKELGLSYTKIRVLLIVWLDLDYRKGMSVITKRLKERRRDNATGSKSNFYNWVEKYPERAKKQTKSIQGWYIKKNGEKVWLRSSLEYIYAKWLDKTDCDWITEERTLKWNDETYRPDFFVYKDGKLMEIVEVKGNYFDNVDKRSKKAILIAKNNNIPLKLVMDIKPYIEEESNYTKELQKWKDLQKQFTEK